MVMTRHASAALQVLRDVVSGGLTAPSDRDLLRRFAEEGDEGSFAALVRRHGPMVLGVCRRALGHEHDAEDACQATFLVLLQKAGAVGWQASVANWLFATARKVSANAQVAARRRARREACAAVPEAVAPAERLTGRELLAALDEELGRLPGHYREPLVLCYLEGLSRDQAAARLGVPATTLKTRLERGRKRLSEALSRRGWGVGAGLLVLAAASPAGASPRLVHAVLAAASRPGPAAAALTKGVAMTGLLSRSLLLVLALAGAVALGTLWSAPPADSRRTAEEPAKAAPPREKGSPARPEEAVSGRVLGPDGRPVAGAAVYLFGWKRDLTPTEPQRIATTDAAGRFSCELGRTRRFARVDLVATAKGLASDWVSGQRAGAGLTLRLAREVPIRGRLLDLEGRPVAGALVKVLAVCTFADGNLEPALNAMRLNPEWLHFEKRIAPRAPAFTVQTRTAADGRFELAGVGRDRVALLRFEAPGIEFARVYVVTQPGFDPKAARPSARDKKMMGRGFVPGLRLAVYGPVFRHAVGPSHDVLGTVKDAATGKPVANVKVVGAAGLTYFDGEPYWGNTVECRTDRAGRFRLTGLPKAPRRFLHLQPGDSPYLDRVVEVKDTAALTPASVEAALEGCVVLEGRITDKVTGKGVPGQAHYLPLADNTDLKTLADARLYKGGLFTALPTGTWMFTDASGKFTMRVLHGRGVILVRADTERDPNARYTAIRVAEEDRKFLQKRVPGARSTRMPRGGKVRDRSLDDEAFATSSVMWPLRWENGYALINPGPKDARLKVHIRLDPGRTVRGRVVGPDGRPLAGARAIGVQATNEERPTTFRSDRFTAHALTPDRPREMVFVHPEKKLAGTITVRVGDREPVVTLRPWAVLVGRVLNPDGTPAVNASVTFQFTDGIADELIRQKIYRDSQWVAARTDRAGRFRLEGMFPGQEVGVSAHAPGLRFGSGSRPVIPKPGETVDLGAIKLPSSRQ
jgi:RNA polymerase sigma factor (sigma-70 family)